MTEAPTGIDDLAEIAAADPEKFQDKITVRDPESSFGFTVTHAFTEANPDGWDDLERCFRSPAPRPPRARRWRRSSPVSTWPASSSAAAPPSRWSTTATAWSRSSTPRTAPSVLPRGIGIAADAPHPATSKLFIDFLLSEEGQCAVAEGGLSSYREGVEGAGLHTYQEVVDEVGEDKVILVDYEAIPKDEVDAWLEQFYLVSPRRKSKKP